MTLWSWLDHRVDQHWASFPFRQGWPLLVRPPHLPNDTNHWYEKIQIKSNCLLMYDALVLVNRGLWLSIGFHQTIPFSSPPIYFNELKLILLRVCWVDIDSMEKLYLHLLVVQNLYSSFIDIPTRLDCCINGQHYPTIYHPLSSW